jgi:hypothetical protein
MALNDFLTYKRTYYHSSLSNQKQEFFMKAVINALEVGLKILENVSKKQEHLEKELKRIKSIVNTLQ